MIKQPPYFELRSSAPEMVNITKEGYGKPVDIWSIGILAYELATGSHEPPMEEESKEVQSAEAF